MGSRNELRKVFVLLILSALALGCVQVSTQTKQKVTPTPNSKAPPKVTAKEIVGIVLKKYVPLAHYTAKEVWNAKDNENSGTVIIKYNDKKFYAKLISENGNVYEAYANESGVLTHDNSGWSFSPGSQSPPPLVQIIHYLVDNPDTPVHYDKAKGEFAIKVVVFQKNGTLYVRPDGTITSLILSNYNGGTLVIKFLSINTSAVPQIKFPPQFSEYLKKSKW